MLRNASDARPFLTLNFDKADSIIVCDCRYYFLKERLAEIINISYYSFNRNSRDEIIRSGYLATIDSSEFLCPLGKSCPYQCICFQNPHTNEVEVHCQQQFVGDYFPETLSSKFVTISHSPQNQTYSYLLNFTKGNLR